MYRYLLQLRFCMWLSCGGSPMTVAQFHLTCTGAMADCLVWMPRQVDLLQCDVAAVAGAGLRADTVVMNPPFGTRRRGADIDFLRAAFAGAVPRARMCAHSFALYR